MKMIKRIKLKPKTIATPRDKINPIRKPDIVGFRKILESNDPLRSVSAFFKFEDIAVSKERDQLKLDDVLNLMKLLADKRSPKIADIQQILTIMKQLNIQRSREIYNAYLKVLVKNNDFKNTRRVILEMREDGFDLDTDSYVSIIQAFDNERHFNGILEFVDSMKEQGLSVNEEVYRHLLNVALKDTQNFRNFEYVLNIINELGYQNHPRIIDVVLKYNIMKNGMDEAEKMLTNLLLQDQYDDEARSRIICTVLSGYLAKNEYDKFLHYLEYMEQKGIKLYKKAYHMHMECLFRMKNVEGALKVYEDMKLQGMEADQFTYLALINGLCLNDDLKKAVEYFNEYHTMDLPRPLLIYRALLEAHCERDLVSEAHALFNFMLQNKVFVSESIYNIMFRLALKTLDLEMMKKYWELMTVERAGMRTAEQEDKSSDCLDNSSKSHPSAESFSTYIELFLKCHRLSEANQKCEEMIDAGRQPDAKILGSLLESNILARNFSGAAKTIQWMRKLTLNTSELSGQIREYIKGRAPEFEMIIHDLYYPVTKTDGTESMIESLENSSKLELITHIYQELKIVGMSISEKTCQLMMTLYDKQKDFVSVVKVWTHLIESKHIPSTETINILLRSAKKYGRQRTISALIPFFEKETQYKLNVESFTLLLSMAASYGMASEIRSLILELSTHNLQLTPAMYNELESIFKLNPKYWREANSIRDFVEEYFPEAIALPHEEHVLEDKEKMPDWLKIEKTKDQN